MVRLSSAPKGCRAYCILGKVVALADFMNSAKILTVKQAAERLESSRSTIRLWCQQGKFPNAKKIVTPVGEHWEIPEGDLNGVEIRMGRPRKG